MINEPYRWYRELTRYHWFVLIVAALGWLFDCLDQQLFNLARVPAIRDLLSTPDQAASQGDIEFYSGLATSVFLMGWATGGIIFGILGDRIGRAKTMMITILVYSICTGLSALSHGFADFALYRFLTGLGVGGEFAVGVALVAEVMPDRARPFALGMLQALSTVGNVSAAFISIFLGHLEETGLIERGSAWRWMFVIGAFPALLALVIRRRLKEPERWQKAVASGEHKKAGSFKELFGDPRWRRRAIVGMFLAAAGVIGLWGIGFFSVDLNRSVFRKTFERESREAGDAERDRQFVALVIGSPALLDQAKKEVKPGDLIGLSAEENRDPQNIYGAALELATQKQAISPTAVLTRLAANSDPKISAHAARYENYLKVSLSDTPDVAAHVTRIGDRAKSINGRLGRWAGITSLMLNLGAFFGIVAYSRLAHRWGRRPTFAISFVIAMISTAGVFWFLDDSTITIAGTPLFTDVFWMIPIMGFCQLSVFGGYAIYFPELFPTRLRSTGTSFCYNVGRFVAAIGPSSLGFLSRDVFGGYPEPMRYAGVAMCSVFLLGLLALPFAPETKGQPLPE